MSREIELYEVVEHPDFTKQEKRLVRKKKFVQLPNQIDDLITELQEGRFSGTLMERSDMPVPHEIYKKRLPNLDTNEGKSNGYRIVYLVEYSGKYIAFLTIYYKKEQADASDAYIRGLADGVLLHLTSPDDA